MLNRKIGVLELDRSTLADLLQGSSPQRSTTLGSWLDKGSFNERPTAVWALDHWGNHGFLPNLLVGSDSAITDMLAWSTAYLQGSGPLSGIMRVMTAAELQGLFVAHPPIDLRVESLAPLIAICVGEVLARRGAAASEQLLTASAANNTLSFSLFRAQFVAPALERDEVVRRWKAVQSGSPEQWHDRITDLVMDMVDDSIRSLFPRDRWSENYRHHQRLDFAEPRVLAMSHLRQAIPVSTRSLFPDAFWEGSERLSAEQLVDILDQIGPVLSRTPDTAASERAAVLAKLISRTNPELVNQLELARPMLEGLPETSLWLTRCMADLAPGKLLSANKGVGWKLAARLSSQFDPLALPSADLAWQELQLGGGTDLIGRKRDSYRAIEIFPGHTINRPSASSSTYAEPAANPTRSRASRSKAQSPQEMLTHAERNLEEALYAIQRVRRGRY